MGLPDALTSYVHTLPENPTGDATTPAGVAVTVGASVSSSLARTSNRGVCPTAATTGARTQDAEGGVKSNRNALNRLVCSALPASSTSRTSRRLNPSPSVPSSTAIHSVPLLVGVSGVPPTLTVDASRSRRAGSTMSSSTMIVSPALAHGVGPWK